MKIITYKKNDIELDIKFSPEENTIWMSQADMATLFKKSKDRIRKLIGSLNVENDVNILPGVGKNTHVSPIPERLLTTIRLDGKAYQTKHYNMNLIKLVGSMFNSTLTYDFISWCESELKVLNSQKMPTQSNLIRFNNGLVELDVTVEPIEETVYLDKDQLVLLFQTTRQNIEYHIANIYESGELEQNPTCKEILQVQTEGGREVMRPVLLYNLDMIISLGFRINSKMGIEFRRWANKILKSYLYKGCAIDENRIKIIESNYAYMKGDIEIMKNKIQEHSQLLETRKEKEKLFFQGTEFDAYDFLCDLVNGANESISIMDPYIDEVALSILKNKKDNVRVRIITTNKCALSVEDIIKYQSQYNNLSIIKVNPFHDRYILIDDKDLYLLSTSINRMAHYQSSAIKIEDEKYIEIIRKTIGQ